LLVKLGTHLTSRKVRRKVRRKVWNGPIEDPIPMRFLDSYEIPSIQSKLQ